MFSGGGGLDNASVTADSALDNESLMVIMVHKQILKANLEGKIQKKLKRGCFDVSSSVMNVHFVLEVVDPTARYSSTVSTTSSARACKHRQPSLVSNLIAEPSLARRVSIPAPIFSSCFHEASIFLTT